MFRRRGEQYSRLLAVERDWAGFLVTLQGSVFGSYSETPHAGMFASRAGVEIKLRIAHDWHGFIRKGEKPDAENVGRLVKHIVSGALTQVINSEFEDLRARGKDIIFSWPPGREMPLPPVVIT